MKDIDFDELDRAVSSVLENTAGSGDAATTPATPAVSQSADIPTPAPVTPKADPVVRIPTGSRAPAITPAPPRRSGRFMDVVHPSSDMTGDAKPMAEKASVTSSMRIEPINMGVVPEATASPQEAVQTVEPVPEKPSESQQASPSVLVPTSDAVNETKWPDPIDVAPSVATGYVGTAEPNSGDGPQLPPDAPVAAVMSEPVEQPDEAPKSPFLSDAKVEKRPLGAFSDQASAADAPSVSSDPLTTPEVNPGDDDQLTPQVADKPSEPLPPELSSDLVSLEGTDRGDSDAPATNTTPEAPATPQVAVSIPQQYKEAARAQGIEDHPVFAAEDHAPLPVTKKKSSPLIWIMLAVIVLAIVVGAGAYWYLYLR